MKKQVILLIFIIVCALELEAAFKDGNNYSARVSGMGGAFTAIADDASAPMYNTAGLGFNKGIKSIITYSRPFMGLDQVDLSYSYLSLIFPMEDIGIIGVGYNNFIASDLYNEYTVLLSYGLDVNQMIPLKTLEIFWGVNVKYLYHGYTLDQRSIIDPVFSSGKGKGNVGFDTGVLLRRFSNRLKNLNIGIFVKNINQPDVGLSSEDTVSQEYRLGFSYYFEKNMGKIKFVPAVDLVYRNEDLNIMGGIETLLFKKLLIIRTGGNFNEISFGLGTFYQLKKIMDFSFNYAFLYPMGIEGGYGSHQISLMLEF